MPDYRNESAPAILGTPDFPFSGALRSGPLADLLASVLGVPGDAQQVYLNATAPAGQAPQRATLPTQAQIMQAQADWNAAPRPPAYSDLYAKAPELTAAFMGAPTAQDVRPWVKNLGSLIPDMGAPGEPPEWVRGVTGPGYNQAARPGEETPVRSWLADLLGMGK